MFFSISKQPEHNKITISSALPILLILTVCLFTTLSIAFVARYHDYKNQENIENFESTSGSLKTSIST